MGVWADADGDPQRTRADAMEEPMPITPPRANVRAAHGFRSAVVITVLVLGGCAAQGSGEDEAAPTTTEVTTTTTTTTATSAPGDESSSTTEYQGLDEAACPTEAAVGEIMGVAVERTANFGGSATVGIATTSTGCSYSPVDAESSIDDRVTIGRISTEDDVDGRLFDRLQELAVEDAAENGFAPVDDLGDDAVLAGCKVVVLDGDAMVWVGYEPADDTELGEERPAIDLAEEVLPLGLTPGEQPDCDEVGKIVADRFGGSLETSSYSGFVGIDGVSIATTGCSFELDDKTMVTVEVSPSTEWDAWIAAEKDSVFTTNYTEVDVADRLAFDTGGELIVDDGTEGAGDSPWEITATRPGLDEAEAAGLRLALAQLAVAD